MEFGGRGENPQLSVALDIMKIYRNVGRCHAAHEYFVVLEPRGLLEKQIRRLRQMSLFVLQQDISHNVCYLPGLLHKRS